MGHPTIDMDEFEQYCSKLSKPRQIQGWLTLWLRKHFSTKDNIEDDDLSDFTWNEDDTLSRISIESITKWNIHNVEQRPAIVLKRNPTDNHKLGIANRMLGKELGTYKFTTFWIGSHSVFCIARNGAHADILATEVSRELMEFAWIMQTKLRLFRLEVAQLGELYKLEEASENFVVPVILRYAYEESWTVTPDAEPLNNIQLSIFDP